VVLYMPQIMRPNTIIPTINLLQIEKEIILVSIVILS